MTTRIESVAARESDIHLSVVATSRNDNHGGSLTHRMQHFVDGFVSQCKRHGLRAELILVEWNPPEERPPLIDELRWPSDTGPCDIRIITVPREIHAKFDHADKIPLFQMIAKNVGIRRARGRFVLVTNIDILFSDDVMRFMRDRLRPGLLYRADRADVPADVPDSHDFSEVLAFCDSKAFRIHGNSMTVVRRGADWSRFDLFRASLDSRFFYFMQLLRAVLRFWVCFPRIFLRAMSHPRQSLTTLVRLVLRGSGNSVLPAQQFIISWSLVWRVSVALASKLIGITGIALRNLFRFSPFTNACGDFTLLSRADWFRLRGYAEWHVFSWHIDSLLIYQALGSGLKQRRLTSTERIFHIEHGRGFTPEGAAELFSRLANRNIPFISDDRLERLRADVGMKGGAGIERQFNDASWGLADAPLPEETPTLRPAAPRRVSAARILAMP